MAKDNLWSWVILAVVAFVLFLEIGIMKGFSVLLPDLREQLSTSTWIIGSCISVITGWGYVLGLSAGALVKRFGFRICLMGSGLLSSVGLIVCACATNVNILLLGLILTGFLLLQANIAVGLVPEYFDTYYNTAVYVHGFGAALGVMLSPLFMQLVLDAYGWRGALLMLSGLNLHSIPCSALVNHHKARRKKLCESEKLLHSSNSTANDQNENSCFKYPRAMYTAYSVSLLTTLPFLARVLLPGIVNGYTLSGWLIYIVSFALSDGASMRESSIVATCGGIGLVIIKIPLLFLNKLMTHKQLLYISSFMMAISLVATTLSNSILGMCMASVLFGASTGILASQIYIAAKNVVKEDEYLNAVAWYHLFYGFATILSGSLTGLIFDVTGSFTFSFIILSGVSLLTAVSLGLEDIWARINRR